MWVPHMRNEVVSSAITILKNLNEEIFFLWELSQVHEDQKIQI